MPILGPAEGTAESHVQAVTALIDPDVRVYDGNVPETPILPYAVLWIGTGTAVRSTLATISDRRDVEFQITSVGLDPVGARWVAERVRQSVLDVRPVVASRRAGPVYQVTDQPLQVDRDVTPHRMYLVDVYAFSTT